MVKRTKVPITLRALKARINRRIQADGEVLKTAKGEMLRQEVGDHYLLDLHNNRIGARNLDIEEYARGLGILKLWEELES